jgi:hypothetical protein
MLFHVTRRRLAAAAFGLVASLGLSASAQVIYEPVQYQYQYNGCTFYYGGHDPHVFDHVARDIERTSYQSLATSVHVRPHLRVYSDNIPFQNLADNSYSSYRSYSAADAQNEANANVPLYFRKSDLLRAAQPDVDGTFVVPAHAQPPMDVDIRVPAAVRSATRPTARGTILIIPRKMLQPQPKPANTVAMNK